jgi:hypothetical protein
MRLTLGHPRHSTTLDQLTKEGIGPGTPTDPVRRLKQEVGRPCACNSRAAVATAKPAPITIAPNVGLMTCIRRQNFGKLLSLLMILLSFHIFLNWKIKYQEFGVQIEQQVMPTGLPASRSFPSQG